MIHLVTFATPDMSISAQRCVDSAITQGVTRCIQEGPISPSPELTQRGCGYWKWKPRVILDAMTNAMVKADSSQIPCRLAASVYRQSKVSDGDILIYSDAGVEFIEPVQTVIDLMDQDIFLFGNQHLHAHWCKRDIVEEVWALPALDNPYYDHSAFRGGVSALDENGDLGWDNFGTQAQASVIFFRVNDHTRRFVKEWLDWCLFEGGRLIDDSPSRTPNHPEFKENRHDQAILTTLAYREGIKLHEWFVEYEGYTPGRLEGYKREFERPLFFHHRFRNADWEARGIAA